MPSAFVGFHAYGSEVSVHSHDHHQIVLPHLGRMEIEVGGSAGVVASGTGAFIAAGTTHTFVAASDGRFIVVDLPSASRMAILASFERGADAFFPIAEPIRGLLDHLAGASARGGLSADGCAAWSLLLLEEIARSRGKPPDPDEVALRRAFGILRAHAGKPIRVHEVAAMTGLSRTRLHVLFRERLGTSPHAVLVDIRLSAAGSRLHAAVHGSRAAGWPPGRSLPQHRHITAVAPSRPEIDLQTGKAAIAVSFANVRRPDPLRSNAVRNAG